jgi:hypothetical protein
MLEMPTKFFASTNDVLFRKFLDLGRIGLRPPEPRMVERRSKVWIVNLDKHNTDAI